jgi:hypothetical protein
MGELTDIQMLTAAIVLIYVHYNYWVKIERKAQYMRWLTDRPDELREYEELKKFEDSLHWWQRGRRIT